MPDQLSGCDRVARFGKRMLLLLPVAGALLSCGGCATQWQTTVAGVGAATAVGAYSPTSEIEQIYYLGVFDPQDQIPPSVYRVRVKGQASFLSFTKFASGWVPSALIDSLGNGLNVNTDSGDITGTKGGEELQSTIDIGRRLMMLGPEGFREAPANHRLVIVMGSSPKKFFEAIDQTLGQVSKAAVQQRQQALDSELLVIIKNIQKEKDSLAEVEKDLAVAKQRVGN